MPFFRLIVILVAYWGCVGPVQGQTLSWIQTGDTNAAPRTFNSVLFAHSNASLFVGTENDLACPDYCGSIGSIFRSVDNGLTWESIPFEGEAVVSFAEHPDGSLYLATPEDLFKSTDNGNSWSEIPTEGIRPYFNTLFISKEGVLYAGISGRTPSISGGLYRSPDNGLTWTDLPFESGTATRPSPIDAIVQTKEGRILAAGLRGVFAITDSLKVIPTAIDSANVNHLVLSPDGILYANSFFPRQLYRSFDNGISWDALPLPGMVSPTSDFKVRDNGHLFLSSRDGVYVSYNQGDSWERLGEGFEAIAFTEDNHLVSTEIYQIGKGPLYRSSTAVLVANTDTPSLSGLLTLHQNYPNPFSNQTTIPFILTSPEVVHLEIVDVLGRVVASPFNSYLPAGYHEIPIDAQHLSSGIYFYRLQTSTHSKTNPMHLQRQPRTKN